MRSFYLSKFRISTFFLTVVAGGVAAFAEPPTPPADPNSGDSSMFWIAVIVLLGMGGAGYFWLKSKKGVVNPESENRYKNYYKDDSYDLDEGVDAAKELEWLRKAKESAKSGKGSAKSLPKVRLGSKKSAAAEDEEAVSRSSDLSIDTKAFQEKMRKLQYSQLPINSFFEITKSKAYEPLQLSSDESLVNAIDQANEEYEEDEAVRELAVRVLAAFRTRNSIEALTQIAHYDLSSNLRSKAVAVLTDFDHETVFEPILLACADPTREVRAAAARGLFRLNFDRADAWKRLIETNDEFRMSHAVRAAVEAGIVVKSFERLIHDDLKVAYEAFVLVALAIRAGETSDIFDAIKTHKDERVKFALLHVLKVLKEDRTMNELSDLTKMASLSPDVVERVRETIISFSGVTA